MLNTTLSALGTLTHRLVFQSWCSRSCLSFFTQHGSRTRSQRCQWSAASWRHPTPTARGRSGWPTGCMAGQNWVGGCSEHTPSPISSTLCREPLRCHLARRQECAFHSDVETSERMARRDGGG